MHEAVSAVNASTIQDVPTKLFGIRLGDVYDLGQPDSGHLGSVPVKSFTGSKSSLMGVGVQYYFEPMESYEAFPFLEMRREPGSRYFESSFRLYLLPVIPADTKSAAELEKARLKWEVALIEWSGDPAPLDSATERRAYSWAWELCKTFAADLTQLPIIRDDQPQNLYSCTFISEDRSFEISSLGGRRAQLAFRSALLTAKDEAVERTLRKLAAKQIRPY